MRTHSCSTKDCDATFNRQRASALQLADQLAARLPSADYWHRLDTEPHTTALRILSTATHLARQLSAWSDDVVCAMLPGERTRC